MRRILQMSMTIYAVIDSRVNNYLDDITFFLEKDEAEWSRKSLGIDSYFYEIKEIDVI